MGTVANADMRPRLLVARGARAAEQLVLARIAELADEAVADVSLLARPVWVVVPSRSLRDHLAAALLRRQQRASAGIAIVTLRRLALAVLEAMDEAVPRGERLLPVLVQRSARREPALAALVGPLQDAHPVVVGSVRDLLDAGFEPGHADGISDLLAERGEGAEEQRALALVRVAAAVATQASALGLATTATVLRRAADLLQADPDQALPSRAVLIHGFADATGVATDLIEALLRHKNAWLVLDGPPDPDGATAADSAHAFSQRLAERLERVARREPAIAAAPSSASLALFAAPGAHAEAREVARRIRALLDAGTCPEHVGVVARDLAPYTPALQLHFGRLGVPFSALGAAGSRDATARRVLALAELLRRRGEAAVDVWLNAANDPGRFELRIGLHAVGAARLSDVAALDMAAVLGNRESLPLPVQRGLEEVADGEPAADGRRRVSPRRHLAARELGEAVARAARLAERLGAWPVRASAAAHRERLAALLAEDLDWDGRSPADAAVQEAQLALVEDVPANFALDREEFFLLLSEALASAARARLGGEGGGVQVLSVTEARGRTFAHLFVIGANRDAFPRTVREDSLFPDRMRGALAVLLPDVPIKRVGFDEERYLFAQLLASAERVTVSWQACDDDGKVLNPSPLVERLRLARRGVEVEAVADALAPATTEALRAPLEHAMVAGLHGTRRHFRDVLAVACAETSQELPAPVGGAVALAAARVAVLDELDPDRRTSAGRARAAELGPYFGFVGAPAEGADPRRQTPFITTLEGIAACPWQVLLRKALRLEPPLDAVAVPEMGRNLAGQLVHAVLQRVVREAAGPFPESLTEVLTATPRPAPWPEKASFERALAEEAAALAREAGLALPGLWRLLAAQARPFLAVARELEWPDEHAAAPVVGIEVEGSVVLDGEARAIGFRADRVDRTDAGPVLTDYKTGRPLSEAKTPGKRREHFLQQVRSGESLQAVAYALGAVVGSATGRYLFLRPDLPAWQEREFGASGSDADFAAAFAATVRALLAVWDQGSFFPRLITYDGRNTPSRCDYCEVRDACLQGDSGARMRLFEWARRAEETAAKGEAMRSDAETALLAVWRLASKPAPSPRAADEGEA